MKLLILASNYPYSGNPSAGIFNERCALVLQDLCEHIEVVSPRPYVPLLLPSFAPRWRAYSSIKDYELRKGVPVHRPASPVIPGVAGSFWFDLGAFLRCRQRIRKLHHTVQFDAILSFDLLGAGGIAWRVSRDLGIPACGWATGDDVLLPPSPSYAQVVIRALNRLNIVFYQSQQLMSEAAGLLGTTPERLSDHRHMVLPRGIPAPPHLARGEMRKRVRAELGLSEDQVLVVNIGRISREKAVFELVDAFSMTVARNPKVVCLLIGSIPAFDDSNAVNEKLKNTPSAQAGVRLLPACSADKVSEYLAAADLFAFGSYHEGMPNSLLEAMAMGVPSVAFAIPPVLELEGGTGALVAVPPFDSALFSQSLLHLADSPSNRSDLEKKGKARVTERYMMKKNMGSALDRLLPLTTLQRSQAG
jgi:teichuronic acid biosynthesis glycosyltransferase TuaC